MEYGTHLQIDRLERTEGPLHHRQTLVGRHGRLSRQVRCRQARTHHVKAIECGLLLNLFGLAFPREARVGDVQLEVLAHPEVIDDAAYAQGNLLGALEAIAGTRGRVGDLHQLGFGGLQQRLAFAAALLGQ
ncbi:hypothetical protein D3C87_1611480 [compost metagenome]